MCVYNYLLEPLLVLELPLERLLPDEPDDDEPE